MNKNYFELFVRPSSHKELFMDFLLSFSDAIEESGDALVLRSEESLDDVVFGVEEFAKKLSEVFGKSVSVQTSLGERENEDWIKKYQDSIEPVQAGCVYVRPSWRESKEGLIDVVIDPALAFGSGHHESTYGCLLMLQRYVSLGERVLDVGTGSGILAIASSKLGAITDICDTDEQALESAKENFAKNSVKYKNAWAGSITSASKNNGGIKYALIVANIVADVLLMLEKDLRDALLQDGVLILSGILNKYENSVKKAYGALTLIDEFIVGEWHTLVYKR
ncbi:MAG: 50S ribosomal protein L11 methyltransferase [Campylobacteraceae bacterium]|jgi:ribosomal protein L11 methyltransferase|nr:50S ribosomal protein L11 methyltransferase [Campylobacteraceae bacterium]